MRAGQSGTLRHYIATKMPAGRGIALFGGHYFRIHAHAECHHAARRHADALLADIRFRAYLF